MRSDNAGKQRGWQTLAWLWDSQPVNQRRRRRLLLRFMRFLSLILMTVRLSSAETNVLPEPMPGLGPQEQLVPSLPEPSMRTLDPGQMLLRRLEQRVLDMDEAIRDILARHQGLRPSSQVHDLPELEGARDRRDAAWELLQQAIREQEQGQQPQDILDKPATAAADDPERRRLEAQNQLATARCFYDLATAGAKPDVLALGEGFEVVEALPAEELPVTDRPVLWYYRFVFSLELARQKQGPAREDAWQRAQRYRDELKRRYPDSYLALTADSLVTGEEVDLRQLEAVEDMTAPES